VIPAVPAAASHQGQAELSFGAD